MSDEEDVMRDLPKNLLGAGVASENACTLGHQQYATHTHTDSGTTGSTSHPKGSLDILLMLSDANNLPSASRAETRASGKAVTWDHISLPATRFYSSHCNGPQEQ